MFVGSIVAGSVHDYALMKRWFDPALSWFDGADVWLDLGFLGAASDYGNKARIHLPHKKPRASKNNPHPALADQQRRENKKQARTRISVEHSIGGMKTFHCLMHRIRNRLSLFIDSFFGLGAGLWNLKISLKEHKEVERSERVRRPPRSRRPGCFVGVRGFIAGGDKT
ncbi:transposase family protein [Methylococcus sp. ANG]|uniref:transposase family protein n=2 Tax=Methylococcus sp. ANG TaxID=3231903 RepID=UPI003459FDD6